VEETKLSFSSGTIFKYRFVNYDSEDKRVIDNNSGQKNSFQTADDEYGAEYSDDSYEFENFGEMDGLSGDELAGLTGEGFSEGLGDFAEGLEAGEGFSDDGGAVPVIKAQPAPEPQGPSYEEIMAEAQAEIDRMKAEAQAEIVQARQNASNQGYGEGLEMGKTEGRNLGYREGLESAQAELDAKIKSLEEEYDAMVRKLEPQMVEAITDVYEHVFNINLESLKGLVMNLALACIQKVEGSSSYMVHVSPADYPFVSMQKNELAEVMGNRNASLDIIEDQVLKKNSCMIETDMGVFDCGLDMQLDELKKELKLLSYR